MDERTAWVQFLRSVAAAANQLADDLGEGANSPRNLPTSHASPEALARGERQRAIVTLAQLREERGVKTAEIAQAIGYADVPNVYLALRALEKRGLVELIPNREPQHWRLAARFRDSPRVSE